MDKIRKPEKKAILQKGDFNNLSGFDYTMKTGIHIGYNQACDEWERWFKSKIKDMPPKYTELINKHFWELV